MSDEWKIKNGQAHQAEIAVINLGGAVHIDGDLAGVELPLGMRQLTSGDRALANEIVVRAVLFDDLAGEEEGIGRAENIARATAAKSHRADDVIKSADFGAEVVGTVAGLKMLVVRAAIEDDVALQFAVASGGVVGHLVGLQKVAAEIDLGFAAQMVDGAGFFLLGGANRNFFLLLPGWGREKQRALRGVRCGIRCGVRGLIRRGIRGRRLAGN